ncbi:MAG TPA: cupredoxin domain-containing protein [Anaeromyxobacteraceae bacterium]|nr:cupredoxin domain-containing protein [Anaeromyxobacteraceae bacterium]
MRRMTALLAAAALAACRGAPGGGPIHITVTRNGFEPWKVEARKGVPLTLVVTRQTDQTCATEIVIPDAGIERKLPLGEPVTITFTPARSGEIRYACAMKMFQGVIDVR